MHHHPHNAANAAGLAAPASGFSDRLAPLGADPDAGVHLTPTSDKARGANAGQVKEQENEHRDSAADADAQRKAFEDLRARLALAGGHALLELSDGSYLVTKWNLCRPLPDLAAVRAFLRMVGGQAAR